MSIGTEPLDHARHHPPRHNHARIGATLAGGVHDVVPDQRAAAGHGVDAEKQQRLGRLRRQLLQVHIGAVVLDVIHADEPGVLGIGDHEFAAAILHAGVAEGHVIGHRAQLAAAGDFEMAALAGDEILAQHHATVGFAVHLLEHLALAATAGALVHESDGVVVRRDDLDGGTMGGDPALTFADADQNAVDALLGAGAGIQVIGKQLVQPLIAPVHDDLPALEVRVTEGRRGVDDGLGRKVIGQGVDRPQTLQHREPEREETGIGRRDHHRVHAHLVLPGGEREGGEFLAGHPGERFLAQTGELITKTVAEGLLVGRPVIRDDHAIRIAAPHVGFDVVGSDAVLDAHDLGFLHPAAVRHFVTDFKSLGIRTSAGEVDQLRDGARNDNPGSRSQDGARRGGWIHSFP
jgi:hypothetical protein